MRGSLRFGTSYLLLAALALASAEAQHPAKATVHARVKKKSAQVKRQRLAEIRLPNGVRLQYAEQGNPAGQPVILLHGYSDSWYSFSRVLPLIPAKYHVFALDQRGHGDSDRPAGGYTMRDLAADVIGFMDAARLSKAIVVGHSMGSFVAQQVALAAPERVERLVLIGSGTTPRNIEGIGELRRAVDSLPDPIPVGFARDFQLSTIHRRLPDAFVDRVVADSRKLPARVWRGIMAGMLATDRAPRLSQSRIPTLILWGDRDAIFLRAEQDALTSLLSGSTLKVYHDTGHALHWERPVEFVRDLKEFVEG